MSEPVKTEVVKNAVPHVLKTSSPTTSTLGGPTVATIGKGTKLSVAAITAGTVGSYTALAELTDIKPPKVTSDPIEVYRFDSPTLYPELIQGWSKGEEGEFTLVYSDAQAATLFAMVGINSSWQLTKPSGTTVTVPGVITEFGEEIALKDKMQVTCKFKTSGAPVRG